MKYLVCFNGGGSVHDASDVFTAKCLAHIKRKGKLPDSQDEVRNAIKACDYRVYLATKNDERMCSMQWPILINRRKELKGDLPFTEGVRFDGSHVS